MTTANREVDLRELLLDDKKFIETLLMVDNKSARRVPFKLNRIQNDMIATSTGRDVYVKPAQVGFSSAVIARRFKDAIANPGTNTVLIAYEDFITQRLLLKVDLYANHLALLDIPGFPEIGSNSKFEKTFEFKKNGRVIATSSFYIASARSFTAGRAETIHHLIADEFAFWPMGATENILMPAMQRVPPDGTVDILSTPNGENDFCGIYNRAKGGSSAFTSHFYPWFMHEEYFISVDDPRCKLKYMSDCCSPEFELTVDEQILFLAHQVDITYDKIRWRRWKIRETESLKQGGETRILFGQEFPEDDISCFLAAGDQLFDVTTVNELAATCYPAPFHEQQVCIWYRPEEHHRYIVNIDPGQAKVSMSAITVLEMTETGIKYCARLSELHLPERSLAKGIMLAKMYNNAVLTWEANSHGLAISALVNKTPEYTYNNIYYREDIISGRPSLEMGWFTKGTLKPYMLNRVSGALSNMICHDAEFVQQLRNTRVAGEKIVHLGASDVLMSTAVGICCWNKTPIQKGCIGTSGWKKR